MDRFKVAIVGATGLVGKTLIKVLKEEGLFDVCEIDLYASDKNYGKVIFYYGREFRIFRLTEKSVDRCYDVVFFCANEEVSKQWVSKFSEKGSFVIDNTNAFRKNEEVPLVVPEINFKKITKKSKIISNPNCSTIELAVVLNSFLSVSKINKVVVCTYQSVSGAGAKAVADLDDGGKRVFPNGIKNNVVAQIGAMDEFGNCSEENKIMFETNKILETSIDVVATTVRVPVKNCHTECVYVEFENEIILDDLKQSLKKDYLVFDENEVFVPTEVVDSNKTFVFRLRQIDKKRVCFVVLADNLRRGAAYNAVEIFKQLKKHDGFFGEKFDIRTK